MGELREIVTVEQMSRLCVVLAIALPLLGVIVGAMSGGRSGNVRRGALTGLAVGLLGPLIWLMWQIFNAITDRNGLDTVQNVFVNLAVFVVGGVVIGVIVERMLHTHLETLPNRAEILEKPAHTPDTHTV